MIFNKVAQLLADSKDLDVSTITKDTTFAEIGLDSLDTVELIMTLEEEFGVTIETSNNIKTVGDVVEIITNTK